MIAKSVIPGDVRSFLVALRDQAVALIPQMKEAHENWLDEIAKGLTGLEQRNFFGLLERAAMAVCQPGSDMEKQRRELICP